MVYGVQIWDILECPATRRIIMRRMKFNLFISNNSDLQLVLSMKMIEIEIWFAILRSGIYALVMDNIFILNFRIWIA